MKSIARRNLEIGEAVRELRRKLVETHADFAARAGFSPRTLTRHERGDIPEEALSRYWEIARAHSLTELAECFSREFEATTGAPPAGSDSLTRVLQRGEADVVDAFLDVLRGPANAPDREKLLAILKPHIERMQRSSASATAIIAAVVAIKKRVAAGDSDEQILAAFPLFNPEFIRTTAANERELGRLVQKGDAK
jgi:AcrR family transcriptional regulator